MRASSYFVVCCVLLNPGALGFAILPGNSLNHQEITEEAILSATLLACRDIAQSVGTVFTFPPGTLTAGAVAVACSSAESSKSFRRAIFGITARNVRVDLRHALNASFHFDDEMFLGGRRIIATGLTSVKASNREGNFETAREILGEILHPLQDFYSHSNWVELGNRSPHPSLLRADADLGSMAAESRPTCRNCVGEDCSDNILEDILREGVLTSGYFAIVPLVSTKPPGKCSHGGGPDQTSTLEPRGGINKDTASASHGHLHRAAARLATAATAQLLADVAQAAGETDFLRMMGVFSGSSKALVFVVDTTESMSDDLPAVKAATETLVTTQEGTPDEPSVYILVPFGDPGFGPLMRTTDSKAFMTRLNALTARGGGDSPEMSLSALKLALTAAPSDSEIFLFTDASAKDTNLKGPVIALMERTQTVVNFMLTGTSEENSGPPSRGSSAEALLYRQLAQASGGLAIEVTKSELTEAISIITASSADSLVTLLQASRSPGRDETFSFPVDESVRSLTVCITGGSMSFTISNPSGESQSSTVQNGPLGVFRSVGNLKALKLKTQVGEWTVELVSSNPYTLKVTGQSDVDFLFDFVEMSEGPFAGLDVLGSRPRAGASGTLLLSLTAPQAALTEVLLVEPRGGGAVLARFSAVPAGAFGVRVKGRGGAPGGTFQRQAPGVLRSSNITVRSESENIIVPGTPFLVRFTVTTGDVGGNFSIQVTDDRGFVTDSPARLELVAGGEANGTVTLSVPRNTPSGSDVTLTIQAEAPGGADANYVVERYSVVNTVTDFQPPSCTLVLREGSCGGNCSQAGDWAVVVDVADASGVGRLALLQGNGTLSSAVVGLGAGGQNASRVTYRASCCSPEAELLAVDGVGNVGSCPYSARGPDPAAQSPGAALTPSCLGLGLALVLALALVWPAGV
ncbi:von Willebrand factor A domain-containing protein 7-like [Gadus chalcogrammus]|uniref:von Willebrand factor A domain-containing protein 7-like n=1 Tax=Gadus chalcogrammus TaxID=1042646 RepID=UPI0024C33CEE|nr:von Willebrand factor A domain-containing protein 7-like [Gadus chalcogrammus]